MLSEFIGIILLIFWSFTFCIGALPPFGASGNLLLLLIYIEIVIFSLVILFNTVSYLFDDLLGSFLSLLLLPIAGCESAIGLSIIYSYYSSVGTVSNAG